jgi:hypothetical protein
MAASHNWASLPGPLVDAFCCLASSQDLAQCSLVCRGWRAALQGSGAPWAAALLQEFGYGAHAHRLCMHMSDDASIECFSCQPSHAQPPTPPLQIHPAVAT